MLRPTIPHALLVIKEYRPFSVLTVRETRISRLDCEANAGVRFTVAHVAQSDPPWGSFFLKPSLFLSPPPPGFSSLDAFRRVLPVPFSFFPLVWHGNPSVGGYSNPNNAGYGVSYSLDGPTFSEICLQETAIFYEGGIA